MEFPSDFGRIAYDVRRIVKIDSSLLPVKGYRGLPAHDPELQRIISDVVDEMGRASAVAQELKSPITSAERLSRSDHAVYLMTEKISGDRLVAVSMLKTGTKMPYLFDKNESRPADEAVPVLCLLDFYKHETRQRRGYGEKLVRYMLRDNETLAGRLAFDQPTDQLLRFLRKHFGLSKSVDQGNKFTVFEEFFENDAAGSGGRDSDKDDRSSVGRENRVTTCGFESPRGAVGQRDYVADVLRGGEKTTGNLTNKNGFELSRVNVQEFVDWKRILDSYSLNCSNLKLDIKYFHTPLW